MALYSSRRRRFSRGGVALGIAVALALGLIAAERFHWFGPATADATTGPDGGSVFDDAQVGAAEGFAPFAEAGRVLRRHMNSADRVRALEDENRDLKERVLSLEADLARMGRYQALLGMAEPNAAGGGVPARLLAESPSPFSHIRLANAGRRQGVGLGWVAINQSGVVGRVIAVGGTSARVMMISDPSSRVPVVGEVNGARAMLVGLGGAFRKEAILTDVTSMSSSSLDQMSSARLSEGEPILTSNAGGVFPGGLLIGHVVKRNGQWRVALAADLAAVDYIRLTLPATAPKAVAPPADNEVLDAIAAADVTNPNAVIVTSPTVPDGAAPRPGAVSGTTAPVVVASPPTLNPARKPIGARPAPPPATPRPPVAEPPATGGE